MGLTKNPVYAASGTNASAMLIPRWPLACVPNDPVTDVPVATSSAVPAGLDQFTPPVCVVLFYVLLGVPSLFVGSSIRETVPGP